MNIQGDLKSLLSLWENLARNHRYSPYVFPDDIFLVRYRVEHEGLHFLTKALPELAKALDTFHATNAWGACPSFQTDEWGFPRFLGRAIKSAVSGNSVAVDCVRQLSYIFYKLEVPYEESAKAAFLERFIQNDRDCGFINLASVPEWPDSSLSEGRNRSRSVNTGQIVDEMARLIARILCNSDPRDIRPCHGTGATACQTPNHKKWATIRYFEKLDQVYDYSELFFFNPTHLSDDLEKLEQALPAIPRARVCLVPKDSRGPRVISCEPAELMFVQQGLMRKLYDILETNHLTRGQINFIDQGVNRNLAMEASLNGKHATLDLKDASDMVSLDLVRRVFPSNWVECLEACRSEETILPNGKVVKLNKFAPMGSSCCFPVEALVFWACAQATIRLRFGVTNRNVYVYGDDIICDSPLARDIMVGLEAVGLVVNRTKSYVTGPFRESCGGDYHNGYDVTPVRVKEIPTRVGTGLDTCADLLNEFIEKFGYESSHQLIRNVEEVVGFVFPRTLLDIPMSIRTSPSASNDTFFKRRFNKSLQRFEYRALMTTSPVQQKRPPDWWELLRKELSRERTSRSYPYENRFSVIDAHAEPGSYVDPHSTRKQWVWTWLG